MKSKTFKIDRTRVENLQFVLSSMITRAKLLISDVITLNFRDEYHYQLLLAYRQYAMKLFSEYLKLLDLNKEQIIITQDRLDSLEFYRQILEDIENLFSESGKFSLLVH